MPKQFISQYAMTNPAEDFAESFLAYRMAPKKLQRVSPKRYDYIKKNVFKGLEFDSQKDCDAPFLEFAQKVESRSQSQRELILWTASHKNEITNEIRRQERMGSFVNQVRTTCGPQYLNEIQDPSSRDLSDKCLADVVKKRATLVSLRRDDHDDVPEIKIPLSSISDVTIARSKINLIRQELRNQYGQRLSRLYSSRNYSPGPHEKDLCPVIISNDDHTISEAEMLILTKACEKKTTESFFKQLFEPDFYRILP